MERFIKRKNRASNAQYREGWDRIFGKKESEDPRCPVCLGRIPALEGQELRVVCECGNCACEGCIKARQEAGAMEEL